MTLIGVGGLAVRLARNAVYLPSSVLGVGLSPLTTVDGLQCDMLALCGVTRIATTRGAFIVFVAVLLTVIRCYNLGVVSTIIFQQNFERQVSVIPCARAHTAFVRWFMDKLNGSNALGWGFTR